MDKTIITVMNRRFDERLNELQSQKGQNTQFFTSESYKDMILKVKSAKSKVSNKRPVDYQRLRRFDVMTIGETEKLIVPVKDDKIIRSYVCKEEIFQILHDTHLAVGHGGRNRMEKELNFSYKNITREMIVIFLNICDSCERKRKFPKKELPMKPFFSSAMNERCQVDLIEMKLQDDQYKFILLYQDHLTKFVQLRPIKNNRAKEIAYALLDIFTIFGAPSILQSTNGREFASEIVKDVCDLWPDLKIVHGKPRDSQTQDPVDIPSQDIETMLSTWLEDNDTTKWSEGLRFVQLMKNNAHHSGMNCTPYEAMFGTKLKLGLKNSIPPEALADVNSEEDLENLFTQGTITEENKEQSTENDRVELKKNNAKQLYSAGPSKASPPPSKIEEVWM